MATKTAATPVSGDKALLAAVAQITDELTFTQLYEADLDFRPRLRQASERVRSLQKEQRNRISTTYGPKPPSPDFLGTQLLAVYRGEAASVQLAKEAADPEFPTAVGVMTEQQCRHFKKEMKQRIHEWEGAVRDATGQTDVLAEQKAPLRSIYELYKAGKNKVVALDTLSSMQGTTEDTHAARAEQQQAHQQPAQTHAAPSSAATPITAIPDAELLAEKRRLKQLLHRFESDFERANGERPGRKDRRELADEYHRYGEIKTELARRGGGAGANNNQD